MEDPERLTSSNSPTTTISSDSIHSPEFEFWMVRNPSFPQPNQLSADELFSHGVLLPLDLLQNETNVISPEPSGSGRPGLEPSAAIVNSSGGGASFTSSKRWKDIFKKTEKKDSNEENCREKKKEKKKEKKLVGGSNGVTGAELNINIWPFSRSRSAGNGGSRPRVTGGSGLATRKVSSAPCSRSNSAGESKSRKWPSSPSRGGVHLGRSSPVWQVRRSSINPGSGTRSSDNLVKTTEKAIRKEAPQKESSTKKVVTKKEGVEVRRKWSSAAAGGGPKTRVLNLNVPMCIGYRNQLGCRSDQNSAIHIAAATGVGDDQNDSSTVTGEGVRGSNLFNLKSLFTKKVY